MENCLGQGRGLPVAQPGEDRQGVSRVADGELRIAATTEQRADAVTHAAGTRRVRDDDARHLKPERRRRTGR